MTLQAWVWEENGRRIIMLLLRRKGKLPREPQNRPLLQRDGEISRGWQLQRKSEVPPQLICSSHLPGGWSGWSTGQITEE